MDADSGQDGVRGQGAGNTESPNLFPGTQVCRVLLGHVIIKLFFRFSQTWPKEIQAARDRTGGPAACLLRLPGRLPRNQCSQRAETRFSALDSNLISVPATVSGGRGLGEGRHKGLACEPVKKE